MRVCLVYDCLFPHTIGGAERWYRNLAERLVQEGHEVTYLTLRQWGRGESPDIDPRVRVVTAGPRMALYTGGRRRILPPLAFGLGVLWHLVRRGRRYEVVHTCSFPYFPLLAAALVRPLRGYRLVVDWFEVWSTHYWLDYLGGIGGRVGALVQRICATIPQQAFCFSELHARRLVGEGMRSQPIILRGLYAGSTEPPRPRPADPLVIFAGRLIPEKQVALAVDAVAAAIQRIPDLRAVFYGDGPQRSELLEAIARHRLEHVIDAPGFAAAALVEADQRRALCMLSTSRREGYGLVVVESAARGTPSVVVAGEDNAAVELIEPSVNGLVVAAPDPALIGQAIEQVRDEGLALRERTAAWFQANAGRLSLESSLRRTLEAYSDSSSGRSS